MSGGADGGSRLRLKEAGGGGVPWLLDVCPIFAHLVPREASPGISPFCTLVTRVSNDFQHADLVPSR
jgi:hypothetical protein